MKNLTIGLCLLMLVGCATSPEHDSDSTPSRPRSKRSKSTSTSGQPDPVESMESSEPTDAAQAPSLGYDVGRIKTQLGMDIRGNELGFAEKSFDGCQFGVFGEDGKCGPRMLTIVNFKLLCRDSEDTIQTVVTNFTPVVTEQVKWKVNEMNGIIRTDSSGFGTLQVVSNKTLKGQRLILGVGKQLLGLTVSEVSQIVVPVYWCTQSASLFPTSVLSKTASYTSQFVSRGSR